MILAVLATAALAACGGAQSGGADEARGEPAADGESGDMVATGAGAGEADRAAAAAAEDGSLRSLGDGESYAALVEQRIIKTGEVTLEVENIAASLAQVRSLALDLRGYVGGSQAGTLDQSATLTLRIPAERFGDALLRLHELDGEVISESTREDDVTAQVVDLEARIDNLRASETSYRALLDRAERIDDVLAVQARLDQVRGEIEQLQAQLDNVTRQAELSTLTVTLIPAPEPVEMQAQTWDPGAELNRAIASLVGVGQGLASGLIWFVVVWLPILLVLVVLAGVALRGVLVVRRRVPAAAAPHEPPAI